MGNYSDFSSDDILPVVRAMDIVITVAGILGNSIVCVVFLSKRARDSATNKLILHQSAIDLMGVLVFFAARVLFHPADLDVPDGWLASKLYCKIWYTEFFLWGMYYTSTFNLVLIAIQRYVASCHALWYARFWMKFINKAAVLLPWLAGFGSQTYIFVLADVEQGYCYLQFPESSRVWGGIALYIFIFLLPLGVMFWCYYRVIKILRKKERACQQIAKQKTILRRSKNVVNTLIIITIAYTLCFMPSETEYLLFNLGLNDNYGNIWYYVFSILNSLNLVVNPCIYTSRYKLFQRRLKRLVCTVWRSNRIVALNHNINMALP